MYPLLVKTVLSTIVKMVNMHPVIPYILAILKFSADTAKIKSIKIDMNKIESIITHKLCLRVCEVFIV